MNKILLIIQREYLSRVKKKSFLVLTFGVPLLFIGMSALVGFLVAKGDEMGDKKKVEVVDESGLFGNKLKSTNGAVFFYTNESYPSVKNKFLKSGNDYLLHIPSSLKDATLLSEKKPSTAIQSSIEDQLTNIAQAHRLQLAGIDTAVLAKAQSHIDVSARQITEKGETDAGTYVAYAIGLLCGFLIYMSLFIYGAQVMRGVIEEKTSRIIEVIISSVKPFQLMLGKIIGVGMVGLTQFLLWILLTGVLSGVGGSLLLRNSPAAKMTQVAQTGGTANIHTVAATPPDDNMGKALQAVQNIPFAYTAGCFLFYFLFGYFLYSAIFAAVGSAVDSETETQQFMLPITLPLIFTFIISMNFIVANPDSTLSVWLSLIPFTAPIAMMVRIPFGVPGWQLALSMFLMVGGFLFTTWVAARIYRVGILMYGKKASYKELAKWFMYKE